MTECQVGSDLVTFAVIVPKEVGLHPGMVDGASAVFQLLRSDRLDQVSNHPSSQQSSTQVTWWPLDP